jgi:hypothetical protein
VKRATSLDAEASALDGQGGMTAVLGSVVDIRVAHHHASLLVDNRKGCAKSPCLVRVDFGGDTVLRAGDVVSAYGATGTPVTSADGKTLPHIDAVLLRKAARR